MIENRVHQDQLLDFLAKRKPELNLDIGLELDVLKDNIRVRASVLMERLDMVRNLAPVVFFDSQKFITLCREIDEMRRSQIAEKIDLTDKIAPKAAEKTEIEARYSEAGDGFDRRLIFYGSVYDMLELDGISINNIE